MTSSSREYKRTNLVIGCGQNCPHGTHPKERWVSVDPNPEMKPDIVKTFQALTSTDFERFGTPAFKIILVEGVTYSLNASDLLLLNQFLAEDGCIIIFPTSSYVLEDMREAKISLNAMMVSGVVAILFKNLTNSAEIIAFLKADLSSHSALQNFDIFYKINAAIKKILEEEKECSPLVASALAHIQVYIESRKQRSFRNYFKDAAYDTFLIEIQADFIKFAKKQITAQNLLAKLKKAGELLPSTSTPRYKLTYDPLSSILEICKQSVLLYVAQQGAAVNVDMEEEKKEVDTPIPKTF